MAEVLVDDLVESARKDFEKKLDELRPAYEQYTKLEGIIANFDGVTSGTTKRSPRKRGTSGTADRAARGQRPQEFIDLVRETPGITVATAAEKMDGMNANYLYRLAKELSDGEGATLRKEGKGYFLAE